MNHSVENIQSTKCKILHEILREILDESNVVSNMLDLLAEEIGYDSHDNQTFQKTKKDYMEYMILLALCYCIYPAGMRVQDPNKKVKKLWGIHQKETKGYRLMEKQVLEKLRARIPSITTRILRIDHSVTQKKQMKHLTGLSRDPSISISTSATDSAERPRKKKKKKKDKAKKRKLNDDNVVEDNATDAIENREEQHQKASKKRKIKVVKSPVKMKKTKTQDKLVMSSTELSCSKNKCDSPTGSTIIESQQQRSKRSVATPNRDFSEEHVAPFVGPSSNRSSGSDSLRTLVSEDEPEAESPVAFAAVSTSPAKENQDRQVITTATLNSESHTTKNQGGLEEQHKKCNVTKTPVNNSLQVKVIPQEQNKSSKKKSKNSFMATSRNGNEDRGIKIGRAYQAILPRKGREDNNYRAEYDLVWDPERANNTNSSALASSSSEIDTFLDKVEEGNLELRYHSLHESQYNVNQAEKTFRTKEVMEHDDRYVPWTTEEENKYHNTMMKVAASGDSNADNSFVIANTDEGNAQNNRRRKKKKKDTINVGFLRYLSHECQRSPLACMLYYYNEYVDSQKEMDFIRHQNGSQDICTVCGREGLLICCDTCNKPFHLDCVSPPLEEVPEDDWFCNTCK